MRGSISKYYTLEGMYLNLPVIEGSQEVLKELSEDYHIIFVTASPTPIATYEKMSWVEKHFPFIGHKNTIPTSYKSLIKGSLLFDDSPSFLPKFEGYRILMDRVYNRDLKEKEHYDVRVYDWIDFYNVVREFEQRGWLLPKEKLII